MKNSTARFATGNEQLIISLRRNRNHIKTQVRHRNGEEKAKTGCKQYFDLQDEKQAEESFEQLVKDAVAKGWAPAHRRERNQGFTLIPDAPSPVKSERAGARR